MFLMVLLFLTIRLLAESKATGIVCGVRRDHIMRPLIGL